jgi:hypothetical protein
MALPLAADEPFPPEYVAALRRMSPAERLRTGASLYRDARRLKTAMLRAQQPDWSAEQIERAVRNLFLHGAVDI